MLELQNLSKTYPNGVRALDGISLSVGAGEIVAIVGSSGCGKSTLLRAISGLDRPSRGRVLLDGEPPGDAPALDVDEPARGTVAQQRLYQLLRPPGTITDRTFEITFEAPGAGAYCFTFG